MMKMVKKSILKPLMHKTSKVSPCFKSAENDSNEAYETIPSYPKTGDYMKMLEQWWISHQPNNMQGAIVYETTFAQGGHTSFLTLPSGHCFANPKRCRDAENSRQLAARVALIHCMFGDELSIPVSKKSKRSKKGKSNDLVTDLDSTIDRIRSQNQSMCNIKCEQVGSGKSEEDDVITYCMKNSANQKSSSSSADKFQLVLKLELMQWDGTFQKLLQMRYTKQQILKEVDRLSVQELTSFLVLEWTRREHMQKGTISMELSTCQKELFKVTKNQQNVRLAKEKCLILINAFDVQKSANAPVVLY